MEFHPSLQCLITYSLILSFLGLPENLDDRLMFTAVGLRNFYLMAA
ncbi:MAG: hypothetical protein MGG37_15510 [Trichodesmium sp. MAG_R01]|nr:hypothetical protein [Trichodesmium sp. MAG_R01]